MVGFVDLGGTMGITNADAYSEVMHALMSPGASIEDRVKMALNNLGWYDRYLTTDQKKGLLGNIRDTLNTITGLEDVLQDVEARLADLP